MIVANISNTDNIVNDLLEDSSLDPLCCACQKYLSASYIQCAECSSNDSNRLGGAVNICLSCFARGIEFDVHKSNHDYIVKKQDFPLFANGWQASEDLQLLKAIEECGIGNWIDVSKFMSTKTSAQCKLHYEKYYLDDPCEELGSLCNHGSAHKINRLPYTFINCTENPPRPTSGTSLSRELAGYNAARGDFCVEFNNTAELIIEDIDSRLFEDDPEPSLGGELQATLLDIYRWNQGERLLRKKIVKDHGLINPNNLLTTINSYRNSTPKFFNTLVKMHQMLSYEEMVLLVEGIKYENELKEQISTLKKYRSDGLTKFLYASIYEDIKDERESMVNRPMKLLFDQDMFKDISVSSLNKIYPIKRMSKPLQIYGKPGYDSLSLDERYICSTLRLLPKNFCKYVKILVNDCCRYKGLSLKRARILIKIDVNRVRILYDYLIKKELIYS